MVSKVLRILLAVTAIVTAALPSAAAYAEPIRVTQADGRLGAVEAFRTGGSGLAEEAGVKWERLTFWWRGMQERPGAPLNPFYLPLSYVDSERARGIEVVGVLVNTPDWAAQDPSRGGTSVPKNLYLPYNHKDNYWGQYMRRVAEMYKGRIDTWIIWNEPDITPDAPNAQYFIWSGSPADYYQLLKVAYLNAKEVNPNVRISTAAVTYWTDLHMGREQWLGRFLNEVAADPSARAHNHYFDIVSLNLYTNPENLFTVPNLTRQLMRERGFEKPIWITETNVIPYDDPVNAGTWLGTPREMRSTLEEQANFMLQGIAMGLAAGVEKIEVYKMKDGDGDVINGSALVREDHSKRPAFNAFQVAAEFFSNYQSAQLFAPGDLRQVVFDSPGRRVTVLWNAAPGGITVQVPVSGDGNALRVAPNGDAYPVGASGGAFQVDLAGATMHTDLNNPSRYLIGGTPVVLVEYGPQGAVRAAQNLSPSTLEGFRPVAGRHAADPGSGTLLADGSVGF